MYWSGLTEVLDVRLDRAREAGEERTDREGEELQPEGVDTHGFGGPLVLADGDPAATDPAVVEAGEHE
jgi:hypothetical protein